MIRVKHAKAPYWTDNLQRLMAEQKLKARTLSLRAGLNATAVRDMLQGRSQFPRYDTIEALATALNTSPSLLMSRYQEQERGGVFKVAIYALPSRRAINYPRHPLVRCQKLSKHRSNYNGIVCSMLLCNNKPGSIKNCTPLKLKSYQMNFLDFIEQSNRCKSQEQVIKLFEATLLEFGIDRFVYSLARGSFVENKKTLHGLVRSYPESWMQHYTNYNYIDNDPTYRHALKTKGAFTWKSLQQILPLSKKEKLVMNEAEEAGLKNGVTLALHGPYGEVVGFGLARKTQDDELNKNELSLLYALANQFHLTYSSFDKNYQSSQEDVPKLTDRQREVLQWAALGKGRDIIAEIMGLSRDTIDDHFKCIYKKLNCSDRTVAVLKAAKMGLIRD